jgi:hypothetical protein
MPELLLGQDTGWLFSVSDERTFIVSVYLKGWSMQLAFRKERKRRETEMVVVLEQPRELEAMIGRTESSGGASWGIGVSVVSRVLTSVHNDTN